jgi:membrane-bound metal-dependent hydrolase YbcI (DUF457 family)
VFVGHGLLAFALAVFAAEWRGWPARRALTLGVVAGAFATLPDIDVVYALIAIDGGRFLGGGSVRPDVFWDAANSVHRSMTHSLIVAAIAGPALGAWSSRRERRARRLALGALVAVVAVAVAVSGARGGIVMGAFVAGGLAAASACHRRTDLPPGPVGVAATVGFASHPYGDLLTGQPPRLFYPFDTSVSSARLVLHPDPTLHLLGAFAVELATIWLVAAAVVVVTDRSWRVFSGSSALPGVAYSAAPLPLLPLTLSDSFHSVFSTIGVGVVCAGVAWYRSGPTPPAAATDAGADGPGVNAVATGLTGTTVALAGYTLVYLLLRPDDGGVERISSERRPPCVRVPLPETPVGTVARSRMLLFHEIIKNLVYISPVARPRLRDPCSENRPSVGSPANREEPKVPSGIGASCRWHPRRDVPRAMSTGATGGRGRHPPAVLGVVPAVVNYNSPVRKR